jgi:uncharacterized membrane protein YeaQ/YmgE (transglycosylase-associated protein family)
MNGETILDLIVIGLIVGALARLILPGRDPIGLIGTLAVGVAGSLLGWWAGRELLGPKTVAAHPWLSALAGAVAVLLVVRSLTYRRGFRRRWLGRRSSW